MTGFLSFHVYPPVSKLYIPLDNEKYMALFQCTSMYVFIDVVLRDCRCEVLQSSIQSWSSGTACPCEGARSVTHINFHFTLLLFTFFQTSMYVCIWIMLFSHARIHHVYIFMCVVFPLSLSFHMYMDVFFLSGQGKSPLTGKHHSTLSYMCIFKYIYI